MMLTLLLQADKVTLKFLQITISMTDALILRTNVYQSLGIISLVTHPILSILSVC